MDEIELDYDEGDIELLMAGPDGIPGTADDLTREQVLLHLARQEEASGGFVVLDDGTSRPIGGRADREDGSDVG